MSRTLEELLRAIATLDTKEKQVEFYSSLTDEEREELHTYYLQVIAQVTEAMNEWAEAINTQIESALMNLQKWAVSVSIAFRDFQTQGEVKKYIKNKKD